MFATRLAENMQQRLSLRLGCTNKRLGPHNVVFPALDRERRGERFHGGSIKPPRVGHDVRNTGRVVV